MHQLDVKKQVWWWGVVRPQLQEEMWSTSLGNSNTGRLIGIAVDLDQAGTASYWKVSFSVTINSVVIVCVALLVHVEPE